MKPLSNDLRERILKAIDNHEGSRRNLAARFCVNPSTITRWLVACVTTDGSRFSAKRFA